MQQTFDVIVVGAGLIGSSIAYHLSTLGIKTALFDRGMLAAEASRANYGNIQIQDTELDHSLEMIQLARTHFDDIQKKLDWDIGYRKIGGILLIENESQLKIMKERQIRVNAAGIQSEIVDGRYLPEIEPAIENRQLLGALYHWDEGQIDPFQLITAYIVRARSHGLREYYFHEITGFIIENDQIKGVVTPNGRFYANNVILCTGAFTHQTGELFRRNWNVHFVLGQALVTEKIAPILLNHISSASFFEEISRQPDGTFPAILALCQSTYGNLLFGETMDEGDKFSHTVPFRSIPAISNCVTRYYPSFRKLRIIRCWSAAVADTADGCPLFGEVQGTRGLFVATAFRSTIIVTPLIGYLMSQIIVTGTCDLVIDKFSPDRLIV